MRLVLALFLLIPVHVNANLIIGDYEWAVRSGGTYGQSLDSAYHDALSDGWAWATRSVFAGSELYSTQLTSLQEDQLLGEFADDCPTRAWGARFCWLRLYRPVHPQELENGFTLAAGLNHIDLFLSPPIEDGLESFWIDWVHNSSSYNRLAYRPAEAVPLPAAAWLFITGLAGLSFWRRKTPQRPAGDHRLTG